MHAVGEAQHKRESKTVESTEKEQEEKAAGYDQSLKLSSKSDMIKEETVGAFSSATDVYMLI